MSPITKGTPPDFFEEEKERVSLTSESAWNEFQNPCKSSFTEYLVEEQDGLCAYCECDLTLPVTGSSTPRSRHLEHIKPQSDYPESRFSYENLVASCNGQLLVSERIKEGESCGHRKKNEYGSWFLSPVNNEHISQYFSYDSQDGDIVAAETDRSEDAKKMINILNLNAPYLKNARLNSKDVLVEYMLSMPDPDQAELLLESELESPREFISFLEHCFS